MECQFLLKVKKSANQVNLANSFSSCRFVRSAMEPILAVTEASSSWCDQHWSSLVTIHAGKSFQLIPCCKFLLQENCHGMFKTKKKKNRGICDQFTERIVANLYSIGAYRFIERRSDPICTASIVCSYQVYPQN